MKKILAILLIMTMSVSLLAGCGGSDNADKGNDTTVNQEVDANDDVDEEEEEYIDPRLELAIEPETLEQYITELELTVENWEQYCTIKEETDEEGVEGTIYTMQLPEEVWQDNEGTQVIYLKCVSDDGSEYVMEYENTPEGLVELWNAINNQ